MWAIWDIQAGFNGSWTEITEAEALVLILAGKHYKENLSKPCSFEGCTCSKYAGIIRPITNDETPF